MICGGKFMKKALYILLLITCIPILTGCKKNLDLTLENTDRSTLLVKEDGKIQAAILDVFDKDYYDITEFTQFINQEVESYNEKNGEGTIILDEVDKINNQVILILTYNSIKDYTSFNHVEGDLLSVQDAKSSDLNLPEIFYNKKGASLSKEEALEKDKNFVFYLKENIKVLVNGKIQYHSNGDLISKSEVQATEDDVTFIIYKP